MVLRGLRTVPVLLVALASCSPSMIVRKNIGPTHGGVEYAGDAGDSVLAATDGWVAGQIRCSDSDCIVLGHTLDGQPRTERVYDYYTASCNLSDILLRSTT